jgi:hypothetical protein
MSYPIDELKADLLEAPWRKFADVQVEGRRGPVDLIIRRPPPDVLETLSKKLKAATAAEEAKAEGAEETAMSAMASVVAQCVWAPNAVRPLFTPEEARRWPYLMDVLGDCINAIKVGAGVEAAKGKSEATST